MPIGEPIVEFHPKLFFDYQFLEKIAMHRRPELCSIQATVDEQKSMARLARLNYFPDFTLAFMIQRLPNKNVNAWGIDFGINVPIWIGQKQMPESQEAEERALANTQKLDWTKSTIRGRIKELLSKIEALDERVALYKTGVIPTLIDELASLKSTYLAGKGSFLEILKIRKNLQNMELMYERARIEREILLTELERALGVSLEKISLSLNIPRLSDSVSLKKRTDLYTKRKIRRQKNKNMENPLWNIPTLKL